MHPAASVIFFTSLSGLGYGLIVALSVATLLGLIDAGPRVLAIGLFSGMVIAAFGLSLSLLHLGHPERAWRALSQWRSSWLSREGVLAIAAFVPTFAVCALLFFHRASVDSALVSGLLITSILLSLATVFATAMIYRSLRSIDAWFNPWVPFAYLSLALSSGFVLASAYTTSFGGGSAAVIKIAFLLVLVSAGIKLAYWSSIKRSKARSNTASALGIDKLKAARQFVAPHTQENYLMQEMGYQIARKHADKLRKMSIGIGFVVVLLLLLPGSLGMQQFNLFCLWLAVLAGMVGIIIERWLFFAEAKHSVMLYYGR